MTPDPVIGALENALAQNPDPQLRLALGDRWMALDNPAAALEAYAAVLAEDPAHLAALGKAAEAAEAAGQSARAAGYRRLAAALGGAPVAPVIPLHRPEAANTLISNQSRAPVRLAPAGEAEQDEPGTPLRLVSGGEEAERTTFADVGGLEAVKKRIDLGFLAQIRDPGLFRAYGRRIAGGLLLYGPPGCGKTHIARATAGEVGARFVSVGLIDVLDMWIGESEKRLHELFENARRQAPVVLFLDELDALGQKRSQLRNQAGRNLVNQLLAEMDGLDSKDGVYVLAATNHPWDVDPALKRPGRFDRTVLVPPPDGPARRQILEGAMRGRPAEGLDMAALAGRTDGMSGADLVHLVDSAIDHVIDEALSGKGPRPVRMADFERALKEVRPSIGPWVEMARNYAIYANEGGAYDDLAAWLKNRR